MAKITVNEVEYELVKTGRAQAQQVAKFTGWLSRYGVKAAQSLQNTDESAGGIGVILGFVENLNDDALIELFEIVIGCSREVAEVYFDVADLLDAEPAADAVHDIVRCEAGGLVHQQAAIERVEFNECHRVGLAR